jgi:crotonobetainyl-CoA:carnitine CoA-transferase CaiB-like acyl-CoA transferase
MLSGALKNFQIVDLTRLYPGPLCTLMLADLGADVIKVETTDGEMGRTLPPIVDGESVTFRQLNRNKRSLSLNLKTDSGREILLKLLSHADVMVESFRPGVMKRLKLDYFTLSEIFPSLVYCSISGFGQTGSHSQQPAHDLNYISMAGIIGMEGSRPCVIPPIQIADTVGAFQAVTAILAALLRRYQTGNGEYLDVSLLDGAFLSMILLAGIQLCGKDAASESFLDGRSACYNVYSTSDQRYLAFCVLEPQFWKRFCTKMDLPHFIDRQFEEDQESLIHAIAEKISQKTLTEWMEEFHSEDLCVSPVSTVAEAMGSSYLKERDLLIEIDGKIQMKTPFRSENSNRTAPQLGEHNHEILEQLGYSNAEIKRFEAEGII